jgi:hypothetical protein
MESFVAMLSMDKTKLRTHLTFDLNIDSPDPNHKHLTTAESLARNKPGNTKGGKYHCTIDLLFDRFGISCMATDNFCFYFQNRLIQTSQTGGQQYSDTSPFGIPWANTLA